MKSRKLFLPIFLAVTILFGLAVVPLPFGLAQSGTNISGIISQDTTWTQVGSPYILTNKALVPQDVTLTIQPGVTVNLGGYPIEVNGTLSARGASDNPINFNSGTLEFTFYCVSWNEQTGSGCILTTQF